MSNDHIEVKGARVHNLKNVDVSIPLRKLVCFAGPSGSGKTSLAFHTLLAESKRRFVNSFPNSLKFFSERPAAVDVDHIYPVLPVFGLPQINPVVGSRAVVADIMRLTEGLQNLFYVSAEELCPQHKLSLKESSISSQILNQIPKSKDPKIFHILLDKINAKEILGYDFVPNRSYSTKSKQVENYSEENDLWEVIRFKSDNTKTLDDKWKELKLSHYSGSLFIWGQGFDLPKTLHLHQTKNCSVCGYKSAPVHSVSAFSPFSALGACSECNGYGANLIYDEQKLIDRDLSIEEGGLKLLKYAPFQYDLDELLKILKKRKISTKNKIKELPKKFFKLLEEGEGQYSGYKSLLKYLESKKYKPSVRIYIRNLQKEVPCKTCRSSRISSSVSHYFLNLNDEFYNLPDLMNLTVFDCFQLFKINQGKNKNKIPNILKKAVEMGLGHLRLNRKVKSLSAGEYQRLLLIKYLSFQGTDCLFVLDEPSLGLSEIEQAELYKGLKDLVNQGNTVVIIEHSEYLQNKCDYLFVLGPGSGKLGGQLIYHGRPQDYLKKKQNQEWNLPKGIKHSHQFIDVSEIKIFEKEFPAFKFPIGEMTWVTGPSGVGKSSMIIKTLANDLHRKIHSELLDGVEYKIKYKCPTQFNDVIVVSSELNRFTSRSTVGTVTDLSSVIRRHFTKLPISKSMGLKDGHFSSNSELGMCPKCEGKGFLVIEMQYLEDIVIECDDCKGLKLKPLYALISDGEMTVAEAYSKPLNEVLLKVDLTPKFLRVWEYLKILNLDYLSLDRSLNSLSGGERQRIYLLSRLLQKIENSLLIFENLSFGLSESDLKRIGLFLRDLQHLGNTLVIIDSSPYFRWLASSQLQIELKQTKLMILK